MSKRKQQPVPRKETTIVEGKERVVKIAITSYTQKDFEDNIECRLQYSNDVVFKETREVGRDSLLEGSISKSDIKTELLTTDLEGEYILDKAFLYLAEERGLNLRQDRYSTWKVIYQNQKTRFYRWFFQERIRYQREQAQRKQEDIARLYELLGRNVYKNDILCVSLRRIQAEWRNIN